MAVPVVQAGTLTALGCKQSKRLRRRRGRGRGVLTPAHGGLADRRLVLLGRHPLLELRTLHGNIFRALRVVALAVISVDVISAN
jgi:hypothetical protein